MKKRREKEVSKHAEKISIPYMNYFNVLTYVAIESIDL